MPRTRSRSPRSSGSDSEFDLIVIGGGINGAAIAREAALAGNSVLLLEREDFGSGTSAYSTRLIHGGLRYLEYGEVSLVRESLHERERLLETAPHLVEPLEILLPIRRGGRRGRFVIRVGMALYDLLSLGKSVPRHRMLDRRALLEALPGLASEGLVGGAVYYDAQVRYPERLVIENVLDAASAGACVRNHAAATQIRVEGGRVRGVAFESDGERGFAAAQTVVNAAGPWVDEVLGGLGEPRLIGGTKGSHLITGAFATAPTRAVYAEAASDGRPFFVIPWNGSYLIGTTDERYEGDPGDAAISGDETRYLIDETRRLFPGAHDLEERIHYTYAGVRPLPSTAGIKTSAITRKHVVKRHRGIDGLFSIVGGKLTTHRALAADCLRRLAGRVEREPEATTQRALPGALDAEERDELLADGARAVGEAAARRLWRIYGGRSGRLLERVAGEPELALTLGPGSDCLVGELVFAIEEEWARSLADILNRRTMTGLESDAGRRSAPRAADWLVRLGLWERDRAAEELAAYRALARRFKAISA